jgi:acyl-[acyl-carrier-protein]-phospholipid O-acyltransferase/long-chain-fatty-acid--[acyl-carrier-protein] ligase
LVGNHVSFVDPFLIGASTQRFVRFLMYRPLYEARGIGWLARLMGAVPVSNTDSRSEMVASLRLARERLSAGEIVCIFAEGSITRTGNLLPFKKGFEAIVRGSEIPIVPFHLDRVWGSIFSFQGGRAFFKRPRRIPYPVTVSFGPPLQAITVSQARQAVVHLSAQAALHRRSDQQPLCETFVSTARRNWRRFSMADSLGRVLNFGQVLVGSLLFRRDVVRRCASEAMIGLLLPPSVPAALLNIAISMAGKVPVNLNYTASTEALDIAIDRSEIRTIYTSAQFLEKAGLARRDGMVFVEDVSRSFTATRKLAAAFLARLTPMALFKRLILPRGVGMDALATVIFSSGSTGLPKGVMLSHQNIVSNVEGIQQVFQIDREDRLLGILPFFHSFGFTGSLWFPLLSGFGVVYHANPLDARTVGQLCQAHCVTLLIGTPTFYLSYLRRCTKEQFATLRLAIVGAEKLKPALAEAFMDKFGITLLEGYGCTELSPVVSVGIPDVVVKDSRQVGHKPGTVGHPLPGIVVRIVDPETFAELSVGEEGLVLIKGPNVMLGYLKDPERTGEVIRDGWYVTGDIGRLDPDGFLSITDRLSRFSKIGGEMVPHIRIEEAIQQALGTFDLRCVVTSLPDEQKGERLMVLHEELGVDVDELLSRLRGLDLPNLWLPRKENFFPIDSIPLLGTGKVDLRRTKAHAEQFDLSRRAGEA